MWEVIVFKQYCDQYCLNRKEAEKKLAAKYLSIKNSVSDR